MGYREDLLQWPGQPQEAVAPSQEALEDGLVLLYSCGVDVVTGNLAIPVGQATRVLTPAGDAAGPSSSSAAYWELPLSGAQRSPETVLVVVEGTGNYTTIAGNIDGDSNNWIRIVATATSTDFLFLNGVRHSWPSVSAVTSSGINVVANTTAGLGSANGVPFSASSYIGFYGAGNRPTRLSIGGAARENAWGSKPLVHLAFFDRALPQDRLDRWTRDHIDLFEAQPVRISVPVGGGGPADIVVADAAHAHTADSPILTTSTTLVIADATHGHTADGPSLTAQSALVVAHSVHAHTADAPGLSAASALAIADALHAHVADSAALTAQSALTINDAQHAHTAEDVALTGTGESALAIADALHAHSADGITLSSASVLAIQDALHAHAADGVSLAAGSALLIADALHAHTADGLPISVDVYLLVADATHGHLADALVVTRPGTGADPAEVWAFVLPTGLSAADTVSQIHAMLTALTAQAPCPTATQIADAVWAKELP